MTGNQLDQRGLATFANPKLSSAQLGYFQKQLIPLKTAEIAANSPKKALKFYYKYNTPN